jgi:hypothetical protein
MVHLSNNGLSLPPIVFQGKQNELRRVQVGGSRLAEKEG